MIVKSKLCQGLANLRVAVHQLFQKGAVREAGRYGWQTDLLNTHQVSQTLKRNVQTYFSLGNAKKKEKKEERKYRGLL